MDGITYFGARTLVSRIMILSVNFCAGRRGIFFAREKMFSAWEFLINIISFN
jgi:hypothetical protein